MAARKVLAKKAPVKKKAPARTKTEEKEVKETSIVKGNYFVDDDKDVKFISTGCTLLDLVLGGGWPLGRVVNIVGDRSSGKTLLAIEACANFVKEYPGQKIWYNEAESAFDKGYAQALGMPVEHITFVGEEHPEATSTVEGLFHHLESICNDKSSTNGLYIMDSLDALSDSAEMKRDIDDGSFGASKAKKLSEMFRRIIRKLEEAGITLIVISQIRDKMNVSFGKKTSRSGGKALDFYASIVLFLAEIGKIKKTMDKVERPIGVNVRAKTEKNKVGLPFRDCDFPIMFGYGVDSNRASLEWLEKIGQLEELGMKPKSTGRELKKMESMSDDEFLELSEKIHNTVESHWRRIERGFLPTRKKY